VTTTVTEIGRERQMFTAIGKNLASLYPQSRQNPDFFGLFSWQFGQFISIDLAAGILATGEKRRSFAARHFDGQ
jgi:hypothetical protein